MNNQLHVSERFTRKNYKKIWFTSLSLLILSIVITTSIVVSLPRPKAVRAESAGTPAIQVSPNTEAFFAQTKLRVQGTNFPTTAETVNIYWNYQNTSNPGTLEGSITSKNGAFSFSFHIPSDPTGSYTLAAVGQSSGTLATTTFTLLPNLFATPRAAGVGSTFTITGQAFGSGEEVDIYWNCSSNCTGAMFQHVQAGSTGSFTITNAIIPAGMGYWKIPIFGFGESSHQSHVAKIIVYPPTLALAPLTGSAGTQLTLTAYGFQPNEKVNGFWNGGTTPIFTTRTTANGYVQAPVFTVPAGTAPGSYQVSITGKTSGFTVMNTFTVVAPSSSLSASSGPIGMGVQVTGQGYAPGETVNISWAYNTSGVENVATVQAGLSGAFHVSFVVPTNTGGTFTATGGYTVAAIGATSNSTTQNTFTVALGSVANPATLSPNQSATISGMGYQAGEAVNLYWDNSSGTLLSSATADANGDISQAVTIPTTASPGSHSIVGVGVTSNTSFTAPVTVDTMWNDFGLNPGHLRQNSGEYSLSTANVANLQMRWNVSIGSPQNEGAPSPIYYNGLVYIATFDGKLQAYNATNGVVQWTFDTGTPFANLSSPTIDPATNTLFFGTLGFLENQDHGVPSPSYALDATTGALKWSEILSGDDYGFPTMAFNTIYVGIANEGNGSLLAIDEDSGLLVGQYDAHSGVWGAVGVDTQAKMIFTGVGNPVDEVLAFDATTFTGTGMQPKWFFKPYSPGNDDDIGSAMAVSNGLVYVDSKNGFMYALNESTGLQVWYHKIGAASQGNVSSPAIDTVNNIVYVGSLNKYFYALDAQTGGIIWKVPTGGQIYSSPALANGVVYVASNDDNIYAFDAGSGAKLWSFTTGAPTFSSPVVVNGWLYCASDDGNLYAFSL